MAADLHVLHGLRHGSSGGQRSTLHPGRSDLGLLLDADDGCLFADWTVEFAEVCDIYVPPAHTDVAHLAKT